MAYEILNVAQVTPRRLHALLRLTVRLKDPTRRELLSYLQPPTLQGSSTTNPQDASENVFRAAVNCGFVQEPVDTSGSVSLLVPPGDIETTDAFRRTAQRLLLGATDVTEPNYLLSLYAAWYAVQNERILGFKAKEFETRFNHELFSDREDRGFNTTKFNGWEDWAAFLGWGWFLGVSGQRKIVVPDAHLRLLPLLPILLAPPEGTSNGEVGQLTMRTFVERLSDSCPELDGGDLFTRCWRASRGGEIQGNRLSLMLSTGLRILHEREEIELVRVADASDSWQLFPAEGQALREVTHIRRRRAL